jgi:hypothetical protein
MTTSIRSMTHSLRAALCGTLSLALLLSTLTVMPHAADAAGRGYPSRERAEQPRHGSQGMEARGRGYQMRITNNSSYSIHHLYLSSSQDDSWGSDQLGERTIEPGETYTLRGIPPDEYDIRIVDEDQDACEVRQVTLTGNIPVTITDEVLERCQQLMRRGAGRTRAAR